MKNILPICELDDILYCSRLIDCMQIILIIKDSAAGAKASVYTKSSMLISNLYSARQLPE